MSTTVVNAGLAITAGSSFNLAANKGSNAPMMVAVTTCNVRATETATPIMPIEKPAGPEDPAPKKRTRP